jgi:hypothetical protein
MRSNPPFHLTSDLAPFGLTAVAGIPNPLGGAAWILHPGIFVVWFQAVLASRALTRDAKQGDFWRVVLRGCPPWMRYLVYGFFGYAVVNFAMFILGLYGDRDDQFASLRGFSGHWMVFYVAALAMLSSGLIRQFGAASTGIP